MGTKGASLLRALPKIPRLVARPCLVDGGLLGAHDRWYGHLRVDEEPSLMLMTRAWPVPVTAAWKVRRTSLCRNARSQSHS